MNIDLLHDLTACETDVEGVIERFSGNEALYTYCLTEFLNDPTMAQINDTLANKSWDEAFTAAHALKGLAGNMGFVPLYHAISELVILIRAGRVSEIDASNEHVNKCYKEICTAIRRNLDGNSDGTKGVEA